PEAGDTRTDAKGIEQVYVPAGCFMMGTSDTEAEYAKSLNPPGWALGRLASEQPQHQVCLTSGYWIDKYEVTNGAFQAFVDDGGYTTPEYWSEAGAKWLAKQDLETLPVNCIEDAPDDHPRVCVTWFEAEAYAKWRGGSLPTEAQWEFAARGTESLIYPWGNEWNLDNANVVDSKGLMPAGSYPDGASWVGALDMAGSTMEWVQDWLSDKYYTQLEKEATTHDDPTGPEKGVKKVEKGGWWGSNSFVARSAYRHFEDPPSYQDHHIGFRIVSAVETAE
ncbi:MAG TPA: formylglycine-generating enzyme family protein, partial [Phototrophicaceae bacterium]|nr:formylglycine-generating enzyme family protein [Phototrophicaceae bacterium]